MKCSVEILDSCLVFTSTTYSFTCLCLSDNLHAPYSFYPHTIESASRSAQYHEITLRHHQGPSFAIYTFTTLASRDQNHQGNEYRLRHPNLK